MGGLAKLGGSSGYYRLRVGDYRIGIALEADEVEFVRCLHRLKFIVISLYALGTDAVHQALAASVGCAVRTRNKGYA